MSARKLCPGGCNHSRPGNLLHPGEADYPHGREPWRCLKFRCSGCKQWTSWCNGAADKHPNLCDRCAVGASRAA